jgi:hypothetical protein
LTGVATPTAAVGPKASEHRVRAFVDDLVNQADTLSAESSAAPRAAD